ncbi:hypothetical protein E1B28_009185 [Marasmius oreades]|uniref:Uncharacterized protein n=1 Tax=Marasmius oreades TaxID=181124 RepID=A0A9P7S0H5_9AGAR|nr:uncharacterized protein E1B28_009185 [Marasmius oreades]KAG7092873.1 hypothetical protein E1B28_009185 [Marasmius oreades]
MTSATLLFFTLLFVQSAFAQIVTRRRQSSVGRVIAGVVVGCVALIALTIFCCFIMMRRRRASRLAGTNATTGGFSGVGGKPLFGGGNIGWSPFRKHNNTGATGTGPGYGNSHGLQHAGPYGPSQGNPQQGPYGQGQYPPPPDYNSGKPEGGYGPPPGPPPAAHTADGGNNHFIGGFRK